MENLKTTDVINEIREKYSKDDIKIFHDTIDMLCDKGVPNGCFQDYSILNDLMTALTALESDISN